MFVQYFSNSLELLLKLAPPGHILQVQVLAANSARRQARISAPCGSGAQRAPWGTARNERYAEILSF